MQTIYQEEFNRIQNAIRTIDKDVLKEYAKKVRVGGQSLQAQYIRNTYNPETNYVNVLYTKGTKRSQTALPISNLTYNNIKLLDAGYHAVQISNAILKAVTNVLTDEEKKAVPKNLTLSKQRILELSDDLEDDEIVLRIEKPGAHTKYEFFKQNAFTFEPTRVNNAYHEVITRNTIRWFADIDHTTHELFTEFLQTTQ